MYETLTQQLPKTEGDQAMHPGFRKTREELEAKKPADASERAAAAISRVLHADRTRVGSLLEFQHLNVIIALEDHRVYPEAQKALKRQGGREYEDESWKILTRGTPAPGRTEESVTAIYAPFPAFVWQTADDALSLLDPEVLDRDDPSRLEEVVHQVVHDVLGGVVLKAVPKRALTASELGEERIIEVEMAIARTQLPFKQLVLEKLAGDIEGMGLAERPG